MSLSAQTSRDTVVYVYAGSDTILLNSTNSDISVWTFVSSNGDGGFGRSTTVRIEPQEELCQKLSRADITCFVLRMNTLTLRFGSFEPLKSGCGYRLSYKDDGVRWSSMRYKYGEL